MKRVLMKKQIVLLRFLKYAALLGALAYIVAYVCIASVRMTYPFGLEWMEGGSLEQVRRILAGQPLYVQPSLDFVPYIYPPLYFYCSAFVSTLTGNGFFSLRLVSFLASLGSFVVIFLFVRHETGKRVFPAFMATGLFAATFHICGDWFDIARIDSLYLFLSVLGIYLLRASRLQSGKIGAGICLALAFLTKQTALLIAAPVFCYSLYTERRRSLWTILTFGFLAGGFTLFLDYVHDGWYRYYIFTLPSQHDIFPRLLIRFWSEEIIQPLALIVCLGFAFLWTQWQRSSKDAMFFLAFGLGMVGSSWLSRGHSGSYNNVLLPAYAFFAILAGVAIYHYVHGENETEKSSRIPSTILIYLICVLQFLALLYDPFKAIPSEEDREAGDRVLSQIREVPGEVFIPRHGYLAILAGKKSFAQEMAVTDVLRSMKDGKHIQNARQSLDDELQAAILQQRFSLVISDYEQGPPMIQHYEKHSTLFTNQNLFSPVTGVKTRPQYLYVPKKK